MQNNTLALFLGLFSYSIEAIDPNPNSDVAKARYVESLVNQGKVAAEQLACPLPSCRTPIATNALADACSLHFTGSFFAGVNLYVKAYPASP